MARGMISPRSVGKGMLEAFGDKAFIEDEPPNRYGVLIGIDNTSKLADSTPTLIEAHLPQGLFGNFRFLKVPINPSGGDFEYDYRVCLEQPASGHGFVGIYDEHHRGGKHDRYTRREYWPPEDDGEITEAVTQFFERSVVLSQAGRQTLMRHMFPDYPLSPDLDTYRRICEQALENTSEHVAIITADLLDGWRET